MNKLLISSLVVLPLIGCGGSSSEKSVEDLISQDLKNENIQYISKSCVAENLTEPLTEDADTFVALDSIFFENLLNAVEATGDEDLTLTLRMTGARSGPAIFLPLIVAFCNYELYEENQCNYSLSEGEGSDKTQITGSKSGDSLSFTVENSNGASNEQSLSTVNFKDINYRNGSMTITDSSGTTYTNWSRSADGTEYYNGSDDKGSVTSFIEYSDCSGEISLQRYSESLGLIDLTFDSTWSAAGEPAFEYTNCIYDSDLMALDCSSNGL